MAERPDLIVLGGDYVTWRRSRVTCSRPRSRSRRSRRRTASSPSSAITTTTGTCRRRWRQGLHRPEGRAHPADGPRRSDGLRRHPLLDPGHRHRARHARRVPHAILLAHTPKRLVEAQQLAMPAVISGHTHGGQIVLPGIGAIAAREFPVDRRAGAAPGHDDLRQPRRRHGVRADPRSTARRKSRC